MQFEGVVGAPAGQIGDGVERPIRLGKLGELVVGGAARYAEAVRRGACFRAQTAVTGVAPGTTISTAAAFSLANPLGSGIDLAIPEVSMGYISGTLGAGSVMLCGNRITTGAVPTGRPGQDDGDAGGRPFRDRPLLLHWSASGEHGGRSLADRA
jgi:hypothetical protein